MKLGRYAVIMYLERILSGGEGEAGPLYQEFVFLVQAESCEEAKRRAMNTASSEECSYSNVYGQRLAWRVRDDATTCVEVEEFDASQPVVEILSRFVGHLPEDAP